MNYTQAQLIELSGMSVDRLRHWRKALPSLSKRAGRSGALSFEEVALLTALSHASDQVGLTLEAFSAHYDTMVSTAKACATDQQHALGFWLDGQTVVDARGVEFPDNEAAVLVRVGRTMMRLLDGVRGRERQFALALDEAQVTRSPTRSLMVAKSSRRGRKRSPRRNLSEKSPPQPADSSIKRL